jgi:glucokinase
VDSRLTEAHNSVTWAVERSLDGLRNPIGCEERKMLIAGDIGGTKTLLALYLPEAGARKPIAQAEFHSADYRTLDDVVRAFMAQTKKSVEAACFDVAGPVIGGRAHLTNLPWVLDESAMQEALGLKRVTLLNDLKAVAYAVPHLLPEDVHTINEGRADPNGPLAVIAPGTGLGEAFLIWDGSTYIACSSEGGHGDFGPSDATQAALWRYLSERHGHVAYERVCSGSGLPNIYDFLRDTGHAPEPPAFAAKLAAAADRTPIIMQAALQTPADALCAATLDLFVSILGAESGNLALKILATGGVYLGGGIPPRILANLTDGRFMRAFVNKGRFADLLAKIPVKIITTQAALLGAALYGLDRISAA